MSLFLQLLINIHIKTLPSFSVKRFLEEPVKVMCLGVRYGSTAVRGARGQAVGSGLGSVFVQAPGPQASFGSPSPHVCLASPRLSDAWRLWLGVFLCQTFNLTEKQSLAPHVYILTITWSDHGRGMLAALKTVLIGCELVGHDVTPCASWRLPRLLSFLSSKTFIFTCQIAWKHHHRFLVFSWPFS